VTAAEYVARFLHAQGVRHVFEVIGGMTAQIVDAIHREGRIEIVSTRHEQAAGFAAEAGAKLTGVPGVAMGTSGPGATNLLTAVGSCYFDSVPAVFITGQVNRHERSGTSVRQGGFQETDIVAMAGPVTKAAIEVNEVEDVPRALAEAWGCALDGRPGPVLVDLPFDVQAAALDAPAPARIAAPARPAPPTAAIEALVADLEAGARPLILAGGGVRRAGARDLLQELAERLQVPVVHSLLALDVLPAAHPLRVGMIGTYGNRWANLALSRADVLAVLGSRLDIRQTGADVVSFAAGRTIHHLDCDPAELNHRVQGCRELLGDLRGGLEIACASVNGSGPADRTAWHAEIADLRRAWPDTAEVGDVPGINPNRFVHELSASAGAAPVIATDAGQHQMWTAQSLELHAGQRIVTTGGMAAMGCGMGAGIGAAVATGGPVVLIAGDGAFQVNLQELETIAHGRLPVKMVVLDNGCHGMVRQFQETYFDGRYPSSLWGYSAPDFKRVAKAFGIAGRMVRDPDDVPAALAELWERPDEPFLLTVAIDTFANAYPKTAFGRPLWEMEPQATPVAFGEGA
jgi:acetolactate synthase-1/2/3 large subunit